MINNYQIMRMISKKQLIKTFVSFRRYYLDKMLFSTCFYGRVLDIGGKKENKRGNFRPPLDNVESWEYCNIDASTKPDYNCSAEDIPVDDEAFDIVLMTEVLEHLENPEIVLQECKRILKIGGQMILTMPFLYPIHADPYDFQRWTPEKIKNVLKNTGFDIENIIFMGGFIAVVLDIVLLNLKTSFASKIVRRIIVYISPLLVWLDFRMNTAEGITTGFYISAKKCGK